MMMLCSCGARPPTLREARHASDTFIESKYALDNRIPLQVETKESDKYWPFVYDSPDQNTIGGPLYVAVDKSKKVAKHWGGQ